MMQSRDMMQPRTVYEPNTRVRPYAWGLDFQDLKLWPKRYPHLEIAIGQNFEVHWLILMVGNGRKIGTNMDSSEGE